MKPLKTRLCALALASGSLAISLAGAHAATDSAYDTNDMLMFFRNPNGSVGTQVVVGYSLGSTFDVFRRAATPTDPTFNTVISLGNVNSILNATYGADWTGVSNSLFVGAVGQNSDTSNVSGTTDADFNRTIYFSRTRTGVGSVGQANSSNFALPGGGPAQSTMASSIDAANSSWLGETGTSKLNSATTFDTAAPINGSNVQSTAFNSITSGVMGRLNSSTYSLGSVNNIVAGLDIYRATPVLNASGWQSIEGISGVTALNGYYLGTVTLSSNGAVNFVAVPEPSTYALLALAGAVVFAAIRRRKSNA